MTTININLEINVTDENISDIVCTALEGGINYWASSALPKGNDYKGMEWAHEVPSAGGTLIIHDSESGKIYQLNKHTIIWGLKRDFANTPSYLETDPRDGSLMIDTRDGSLMIDTGNVDVEVADRIVQLGIFGEVIYG